MALILPSEYHSQRAVEGCTDTFRRWDKYWTVCTDTHCEYIQVVREAAEDLTRCVQG